MTCTYLNWVLNWRITIVGQMDSISSFSRREPGWGLQPHLTSNICHQWRLKKKVFGRYERPTFWWGKMFATCESTVVTVHLRHEVQKLFDDVLLMCRLMTLEIQKPRKQRIFPCSTRFANHAKYALTMMKIFHFHCWQSCLSSSFWMSSKQLSNARKLRKRYFTDTPAYI